MFNLGLKCSTAPEQLYNRLSYKPNLIEIQLFDDDLFGQKRNELEQTIKLLKSLDIKVYLHHPIKYRGKYLDIIHKDEQIYQFYHLTTRILAEICQQYDIKCVIHPHYVGSTSCDINSHNVSKMISEIQNILDYSGDVFLWENTIEGLFSGLNPKWIEDIVKPLNLPIVYDISHGFIAHKGDNEKLMNEINALSPFTEYLHVVDSLGQEHDSLPLGRGTIDWSLILPYIKYKPYIYEIGLKDFTDATDMFKSHEYILKLHRNLTKQNLIPKTL